MKPHRIFHIFSKLPLYLAMSVFAANVYAEVVVIVSSRSEIRTLSAEHTARIFLGKVNVFPNGSETVPIDQADGSAIRDEFYSKVTNKNSSQLSAYWSKVIFTGDGHPPVMLDGNVAVRKAVAKNPNAIGYIDKSALDKSVRVVLAP